TVVHLQRGKLSQGNHTAFPRESADRPERAPQDGTPGRSAVRVVSVIAAETSAGRSAIGTCPHPGRLTRRAWAMRAATRRAAWGVRTRSRSPQPTVTGHTTLAVNE